MRHKKWFILAALALLLLVPGATLVYQASGGASCARCHEIRRSYESWRASTHREVGCASCHGSLLTSELSFHLGNLRRVVRHLRGRTPEAIRIPDMDLVRVVERCRNCHRQEYAAWQSGPHSVTYARIFLDEPHNRKRALMDDCLRCHGMHFEGHIGDLLAPLDTTGPWQLKRAELATHPVLPCMACHQVHRQGEPRQRPWVEKAVPGVRQEIHRASLALFDRRQLTPVGLRLLPLPEMREGARRVKMSPDPRQGLCYQCHAPLAGFQVGSGDDRTPIGVHEGISCLVCHERHTQNTRASCAGCHPKVSNCGLDVETMDTTFRDPASRHNIHFVKCADCHPKGVPPRRREAASRADGGENL